MFFFNLNSIINFDNSLNVLFIRSTNKNRKRFYVTPIHAHKPITNVAINHTVLYPTPANISYFWNFGSLSAVCLGLQIITGIFLAMHYNSDISLAFNSVEHIMRDVYNGWLIRYMHANGASAFFAVVYLHIFRAMLFRGYSWTNRYVWITGLIIFILMMATAFIGYVLPWGQMSFWGATVITNLFSVVPLIGPDLVYWIWGGFSVSAATLNRFYSLHYLFPFIIVVMVLIHISYLHSEGSSNPFPFEHRDISTFYLPLYPYFLIKDLFGLFLFSILFSYFIFFNPNYLGHPDNYIPANAMVTPEHIVPEWYFLPFYAILRSVPNKTIGIIAMGGSLIILFFFPLGQKTFIYNQTSTFRWEDCPTTDYFSFMHQMKVIIFSSIFILLGFIGSRSVEEPYISVGFYCTFAYFILIFYTFLNKSKNLNNFFFSIYQKYIQ